MFVINFEEGHCSHKILIFFFKLGCQLFFKSKENVALCVIGLFHLLSCITLRKYKCNLTQILNDV